MENELTKKIVVKIISTTGLLYNSVENPEKPDLINSINAKGVISMQKTYSLIGKGKNIQVPEEEIQRFEILPNHSPFVAKISEESDIIIDVANSQKKTFLTSQGGVVVVSFNETDTIIVFTLEDAKLLDEKTKK